MCARKEDRERDREKAGASSAGPSVLRLREISVLLLLEATWYSTLAVTPGREGEGDDAFLCSLISGTFVVVVVVCVWSES